MRLPLSRKPLARQTPMTNETPIEAVVFDMDGLMLDTEPIYKIAWQSGCRDLGYDLNDATYTELVGRPTIACERVLLETLGPEFPLERFRQLWPSIWQAEVSSRGIRHKHGLAALLAFLCSRNIPTAVATSSEAEFTDRSLSLAGLSNSFQVIVTGDQIDRGKPAPDVYLAAAAKLGVQPRRCIALEDSEAGAVAASTAGMVTLLVPDWVAPSPVARQAATEVFSSLVEAHAFIEARLSTTNSAG
jgi:beta-phosphoglucomutase-like phosphatase (HAD superfamily)